LGSAFLGKARAKCFSCDSTALLWQTLFGGGQAFTHNFTPGASFGWWSLYTDPAGANLYFTVQPGDGSTTTYLTAPIAWASNSWHFIALDVLCDQHGVVFGWFTGQQTGRAWAVGREQMFWRAGFIWAAPATG
jgi:hypothetical protein